MLTPLHDRILVDPEKISDITEGGILMIEKAKPKPVRGTVKAVGPGQWTESGRAPMSVKVGDTVVYGAYAGVKYDNLLILRDSDILGVENATR